MVWSRSVDGVGEPPPERPPVPQSSLVTDQDTLPLLAVVEQFWHRWPGGTAVATERTLSALVAARRVRVTGLAARHSPPDHDRMAPWQRLPAGSTLQFHWLPRPLLYESWMRLGRPSIDGHGDPDSVVWAASGIVPPTGRPVVATIHDLDFLTNTDGIGVRRRQLFELMWRRARDRADLLVCPTDWVADECCRLGVPESRLAVVPWGVAPPSCNREQAAGLLADLGLRPGFVLWVGPLTPRKNASLAARALGRIDVPVVAVAPGPDDAAAAFAWASLGSRVHRLARVDGDQLSALYRGAGALFFPSVAEGFGLPILEAMAHGTPVVTSRGTATEEVAGGAALLVDPSDPDGMAQALEAALWDHTTRRRMVEAGLGRATELTWERTAKGYAEVFGAVR